MSPIINYTATKMVIDGLDVLRLSDAACRTEVSIVPTFGNNAYEMKVKGQNVLWTPRRLRQLKQKPVFFGNPFMAPWANRLDQDAFHANGKRYVLNPNLDNFLRDHNGLPMHGLLAYWPEWELTLLEADGVSARATCRLEFWRYPDLMAQFPFAHTIVMTHRLRDGVLEVETLLENHATEPMPVALGYHPFFQIHDAPREAWKVHFPSGDEMLLSEGLIPTGGKRPLKLPDPTPLAGRPAMYVLTNLARRADGCAEFWVEGGHERVTMIQGPKYRTCVVYAPAGQNFICFEPMAATINAMNPMQNGNRHELQSIRPGGTWRESLWIQYSNGQAGETPARVNRKTGRKNGGSR